MDNSKDTLSTVPTVTIAGSAAPLQREVLRTYVMLLTTTTTMAIGMRRLNSSDGPFGPVVFQLVHPLGETSSCIVNMHLALHSIESHSGLWELHAKEYRYSVEASLLALVHTYTFSFFFI